MIGKSMWRMGKRMFLVWAILFLPGGIGAQAAPVVSSFKVNNGAVATVNPAVTLPNVCEGATSATHSYMASESSDFTGAVWKPYASVPLFILSNTTSGTMTVYFKVKDSANAESAVTSDTIAFGGEGYSIMAWGGNTEGQCDFPLANSGFVMLAAGGSHSLALKADGSVWTWGYNGHSQCIVPSPNRDFWAIAAGDMHSLGLNSDGSIRGWGWNVYGQCDVPAPNCDFVGIAAGQVHSLGLKSDGSIVAWGDNTYGQCSVPSPNSGFVAVVAGIANSLGLKSDGSVVAWGRNEYGECVCPQPNRGFVAIAAGNTHSLGLKSDGSIVAWGGNDYNQCVVPTPNIDFVAVAARERCSLGLKSNGSIVAWGQNGDGQCRVPMPNSGFVAAELGRQHCLSLVAEGSVLVTLTSPEAIVAGAQWRLTSEPAEVWHNSSETVKARAGLHTLVYKDVEGWTKPSDLQVEVTTAGMIRVTGNYDRVFYTLVTACRNGSIRVSPSGTRFPHGTTVTLTAQPDAGYWFDRWMGDVPTGLDRINPFVLTMDADKEIGGDFEAAPMPPAPEVSSFAINNGIAMTMNPTVTLANTCTEATSVPVVLYMVSESADFTNTTWRPYRSIPQFTLSGTSGTKTVYFKVRNSAWMESSVTSDTISLGGAGLAIVAWGDNRLNQCGVPAPNGNFLTLAGGENHSLGLKSDGSVVAWGENEGGQCDIPTPNRDFVAVAGGDLHSLGLKSDGTIAAWGASWDRGGEYVFQCHVPTPNANFVGFAAGPYHNLGLKSDGSIVAWGRGLFGQCNVPTPNSDFVAVAAGGMHSLGLKSDGSIVAWGNNVPYGQCTVPEPNTHFVVVAAGGTHSLGLKSNGTIAAWGNNNEGQCTVPEPNRDFVAIAARGLTSLALKADGSIVVWGQNVGGQFQVPPPNSGFSAIASGGGHLLALAAEGMGNVQVTLTPPAVVNAGAQWRLTSETASEWHDSAQTIRARGTQTVTFEEIYGWIQPGNLTIPIETDSNIFRAGDYRRTTWTLLATCGDNGVLQVVPAGTVFPHETTVTLTVNPKPGYWFDHWTGDVPKGQERVNPLVLTMDANKTIGVDLESGPLPPAPVIASFKINNGALMTLNPTVTLTNVCTAETSASAAHYLASESSDFTSATWHPYGPVTLFSLSPTTGTKTVYFKVRNSAGVESAVTSDTIMLGGAGFPVVAWGKNNGYPCIAPSPNQDFVAIAAGKLENLGLKSEGSIVTWTPRGEGNVVPSPNKGFIGIAVGDSHSLGLKSDGSIVAWGWNDYGQRTVPAPNSAFVAVAAGRFYSLGLKSNGSIVAWGNNSVGQCKVPTPNRDFVAIAVGDSHSLGLKSDGSIVAWGDDRYGQCFIPTPNIGFITIAAGDYHSLGLKSDGSIVAWGNNNVGQCKAPTPNLGFIALTGGDSHSLGLKSDGSVVAWGSLADGQCMIPSPNSGFVAISAWGNQSLALASQGALEVTLAPPEIIAAGARWRLQDEKTGVWHNDTVYDPVSDTSSTLLKSRVGTHTLTFEDITGWTKPADWQVELTTTGTAQVVGLYERIYCTLTTTCSSGTVLVSPVGPSFPYGTTVTLTVQPDAGTWFDRWTGDVPVGLERINPLTVIMDTTRTIGVSLASGPPPAAPVMTSFSINHGMATVVNPTVTLPNTSTAETSGSAVQYLASESPGFTSATWQPYVSIPLYRLSISSGTKTLYFKVRNSAGVESGVTSDTIVLSDSDCSVVSWGDNSSVPLSNRKFVDLAVGANHCLGLKSDGSVVAWGENRNKQCEVPAPNRDFVAVAAGNGHSLGLKSNGSIVAWGSNFLKQCTVPSPNRDFVAVTASEYRSLGLKSDGSLVAWGSTSPLPSPNSGFVAVVTGVNHCLGLKFDGSIVAWGLNKFGQCTVPLPNTDFVAIAAGEEHSLGLKSDGSIVTWGHNDQRQCDVASPNSDFVALAAGRYHSLGLKSDGTIMTWGANGRGQCTVPPPNSGISTVFAQGYRSLALVPPKGSLQVRLTPPEAVAAGAQWRFAGENAWRESGTSITWPVGTYTLELRDDLPGWYALPTTQTVAIRENEVTTATVTYVPGQTWPLFVTATNGSVVKSPSKTNYRDGSTVTLTAVPEGGYHFTGWSGDLTTTTNPVLLTMDSTRTLTAHFAFNGYGLTVNATHGYVVTSPLRSEYPAGTTVTLYAAARQGYRFTGWTGDVPAGQEMVNPLTITMNATKTLEATFAKVPSRMVQAWGATWHGECDVPSPNNDFVAVAAGNNHSLGLKSDGSIVAWGSNNDDYSQYTGQCDVPSPNSGFVAVAAGGNNSLGLKSDGSVVAWGDNDHGQCNIPFPDSGFVAVAAGEEHCLGLKSDGSIVAWGKNGSGQCNVPEPNNGFVAITGGGKHSLGLKSDGSIVAWGSNDNGNNYYGGQCVVPLPNSGFVGIAAGAYHSMGLKLDGSIVAWGDNDHGQCTLPTPNSGFVAIVAGGWHNLGLKSDSSIVAWGWNAARQCNVPTPNSDYIGIAGGDGHSLALTVGGSLQVTLDPSEAALAGAQWRLTNEKTGVWHDSGTSLPLLAERSYTVEYKKIAGWQEPANQTVSIEKNRPISLTGIYLDILTYSLMTSATHGYVIPSPGRPDYPAGTTVTLYAAARQGYQFTGWTGDVSAGQEMVNPLTLIMDTTKTLTATFGPAPSGIVQAWGDNAYHQCDVPSPNSGFVAVTGRLFYSFGLKSDGSIAAWGDNRSGQCNVPSPNRDFVAVSAGGKHGLGLKSDGSIIAWGDNTYGQCAAPSPNSGFVAIASGGDHSLGLKADGSIVAWGYNNYGQCNVPSPNSGFVAISAGYSHSLGLKSDGSAVGWGDNGLGQCTVPQPNRDFVAVVAENYGQSLGLKSDGSIVPWGNIAGLYTPDGPFVSLAVGDWHYLGLKSDGSIVAWGSNVNVHLFYTGQSHVPTPNNGFVAVAAGEFHSLAIAQEGSLQVTLDPPGAVADGAQWRVTSETAGVWHNSGEVLPLNIGKDYRIEYKVLAGWQEPASQTVSIEVDQQVSLTGIYQRVPTCSLATSATQGYVVTSPLRPDYPLGTTATLYAEARQGYRFSNWTGDVPAGQEETNPLILAMDSTKTLVAEFEPALSGIVKAWGANTDGQCDIPSPNSDFVAVEGGANHSLGLKRNGSIVACGSNNSQYGQYVGQSVVPSPNSGFVAVAAGGSHSLGLKADGSVVGWGENDSGQCTAPSPNKDFVAIAAGWHHSLGLKADGSVVAWGSNRDYWDEYPLGQCNVPSPNSGFVAIAAGAFYSLGLKADGSVVAWGDNSDGQCIVPLTNKDFVAVSAGWSHSLGLKSDGSIVAWGSYHFVPTTVPAPNGDFVAVAAGDAFSLGLKSNGSIVAWGDNQSGQCNIPLPNADYLSVAAGGSHSLAIVRGGTLQVTVSADPPHAGTVSKTPDQDFYEEGTSVTLNAVAAEGYLFRGWVDDASGTTISQEASFIHQLTTSVSLTARFKPVPPGSYTVGAMADPVNGGSVSKTPNLAFYPEGSTVTLNATAADGYIFRGWLDGATTVSSQSSFVYTVETDKTFIAKFRKVTVVPTYTLTTMTDPVEGGTVSKWPDQETYLQGAQVTLTATAATGYQFVGWYDGATLLSTATPYVYAMPALAKALTAKFSKLVVGPETPTGVTAVGNTYMVLVSWNAVTSATYVVERTLASTTETTPVAWTTTAVQFADDTAVPGVTYAYTVKAVDALQNESDPSSPATASVTAEVFSAANYKVTCKGYTLVRSASNDLVFTPTIAGSNLGTIKVTLLKKMPSNAVDNAAKGIYYLTSITQVPLLRVNGSVKTLAFDVPVMALVVRDLAKSVSAKSVTFLTANEFGSISITATKDSSAGLYARTFIETTSAGTTPMSIKVTGAVVEEVGSTNAAPQPIKLLSVASKTYKDAAKVSKTSLGAIGSLPKVVNELQVGNTTSAPAEATPCSITGSVLKAITVSGGPLVADKLVGAIDKVTVAAGNLRVGLIQSSKDLVLVQATAKKINGALVGGAVGTASQSTAMVVAAQPAANSKRVAIKKVYGQAGVSGYFYAGYDAEMGAPTQTGGIGVLQTKSGQVEGAAFLDPALVSKMKVLPKDQEIVINPTM